MPLLQDVEAKYGIIQPSMSEQEKKQQRIYDFLNIKIKPNFLGLLNTKQKKKILIKIFCKNHKFYRNMSTF